jgi:hypothetical protein
MKLKALYAHLATLAYLAATSFAADTFEVKPKVKILPAPAQTSPAKQPASNHKNTILLKVGEIRPVFVTDSTQKPQLAFYLPPEGVPFVQLIVEKRGSQVTYFAKGMQRGRTLGGSVERAWLDRSGFSPASLPDEGRIQQALKSNPLFLTIE